MAPPPMEAELSSSATTIGSLSDDLLTKIFLLLETPVALVRAAAASKSLHRVISGPDFLPKYRELHRPSPFLGLYIPLQVAGAPLFIIPNSFHCAKKGTLDADLMHAALKAVNIGGVIRYEDQRLHDAGHHGFKRSVLEVHAGCRLLDCHNSRLLLTRGEEALEVRSPLARESVVLPFPPDVDTLDSFQACLLQGHNEASSSFRLVCLQHHREGRHDQLVRLRIRAVEYDSSRKSWLDYPWETYSIAGMPKEAMHAGYLIFWKLRGPTTSSLLLDTRTMRFDVHYLPSEGNFAIGEMEDSKACLVEICGCKHTLIRVWQLEEENLKWKLHKTAPLEQVLGNYSGYYRVSAITNGILLLCSTSRHQHFVVDLHSFSLKEDFDFKGVIAWPMQMPWPPIFTHLTTNAQGGLDQDGGGSVSLGDARIGAGEPSPGPSLGGCFSADPSQEAKKAQLLLSSSNDSMCSVPSTSCSSQDIAPATTPLADILPASLLRTNYIVYRRRMALTPTSSSRRPQQAAGGLDHHAQVLSTGQVPVPNPDANMAEASEAADANQESEINGQKQDKESPPTRRVNDAKERKRLRDKARRQAMSQEQRERERLRDRARHHAMSQEQRERKRLRDRARQQAMSQEQKERKNQRNRARRQAKQKQQPNIKNINVMNPESSEENQHELRDLAVVFNSLVSNEPQDLDIQDPTATAPTEEPTLRLRSLNHDLMLLPLTLASCTQQGAVDCSRGGKRRHDLDIQDPTATAPMGPLAAPVVELEELPLREQGQGGLFSGSNEATTGQGRRQKTPNRKYFGAKWCIDNKQ